MRIISVVGNLPQLLRRLWGHLSRRRKRQMLMLVCLMLLSAFAEVVSLGAVVPFLGVLTSPEQVFQYPLVANMASLWGIDTADQMVLPLTIAFALAALVAGAVRLLFLWLNVRVSNASGADLCLAVYERTLNQPYRVHVARNSSEIISGIHKVSIAQSVLQTLMSVVSSIVLIISIMAALLMVNAEVAIAAAAGFGICYAMIIKFSRWRLEHNSQRVAYESTQMVKALQEGMGGIRDILLDGTQSVYCSLYRTSLLKVARARGGNQIMGTSPRYIMEAIGMVLIAVLAYSLSLQDGGVSSAMPVLGALALGAQRILPAIQQLYGGWASLAGNRASLADALALLDQPMPEDAFRKEPEPLEFSKSICFDHVSFRYGSDHAWVLEDLNMMIPKGARVGFVGSTGSGKSTTLDLLMGLLTPSQGSILVDGLPVVGEHRRAWQRTIAHVPQSIYLADASIAENIAFGVPPEKVDEERVKQSAIQAQIAEHIDGLPEGYQTVVGERGVRLSGGQRQRVGIARSLYKNASVLVFDEATSALDNATEHAVVDSIAGLDRELTILIVAHRLSTVRDCDIIFELDKGGVAAQGTYDHLLERSPSFRKMAMSMN